LKYQKIGNHIVSEAEAIKWFSSFSDEFSRAVINAELLGQKQPK
jgi:hypothetical protein